jgi:hypothetical protein
MPDPTTHLVSIGHLCQEFQLGHFAVLKKLDAAGLKPVMTLNVVPYYDFDKSFRLLDPNPPTIHDDE